MRPLMLLTMGLILIGALYGIYKIFITYPLLDIFSWTFIGASFLFFGFLTTSMWVNKKHA